MLCKQIKIDVATGTLMVGTCLIDIANAEHEQISSAL
jgi:hypothetical protein